MAARNRVKRTLYPSGGRAEAWIGSSLISTTTNNFTNNYRYSATCDDVVGSAGADHNLTINKWVTQQVEPLNGSLISGGSHNDYYNFFVVQQVQAPGHLALPSQPSTTADAVTVLARTNPNRYSVDMVQNLVDIGDLPKLVRVAGDTILKRGAGAYLSWQFGWAPLISDVKKMLDFQRLTDLKVKELHKLYQAGGIHRRLKLRTLSAESSTNLNLVGLGSKAVTVKSKQSTVMERWGSVRYLPASLPPKDETAYRQLAFRIVYGLELSPASVWEALPWTWLIDWFSNIGDYLSQYNNVVPVIPSAPCIMTHTKTRTVFTRIDQETSVAGGTIDRIYETKLRVVASPGIQASIPFLGDRQLSILAALFITKRRAT